MHDERKAQPKRKDSARPRLVTMKKLLARLYLKAIGWTPTENHVTHKKFVLLAAPHTSNWDLPTMLALGWHYGLTIGWIGKHTLFNHPLGWFMKWLGGIPVDRSAPQGLTAQMAEVYRKADSLIVAVPPEGTRGRAEYWKSGFLQIARAADVPIVLGALDYATKSGGFGPVLDPHQDVGRLMDQVREFYADKRGKFPENFGPVRLKAEEIPSAAK